MDFQSLNDDEEDGAELFFEGPDADAVAGLDLDLDLDGPTPDIAAAAAAAAAAAVTAPRRKAAAVKATAPAPLDAATADDADADADADADDATPPTAAVAGAEPAVAPPAPPVAIVPIPRKVMIALVLAVVASLFSAIGLIVTARNLAVLAEEQHDAAKRGAAFTRLPALLTEVEKLAADQRTALARAIAAHPSAGVSPEELTRQLDGLRFAIAKSQPVGSSALAGVVSRGQTELAHRIDEVSDRLDTIQGRHKAH